ncbi:MAG: hypothetical protein ACTSQF_00130 [Candidatus Heimdallarchaeaceae archaeon]
MSIELQDNIYTEAPKATDEKMFFGTGVDLLFKDKDDIPEQYRFEGMIAHDTDSPYTIWQLQGGIHDGDWTDITSSAAAVPDIVLDGGGQSNAVEGQTVFTLPGGLTQTNCMIFVNGIHMTAYTLVDNGGTSTLTFLYGLEPWDGITYVKFENIV